MAQVFNKKCTVIGYKLYPSKMQCNPANDIFNPQKQTDLIIYRTLPHKIRRPINDKKKWDTGYVPIWDLLPRKSNHLDFYNS